MIYKGTETGEYFIVNYERLRESVDALNSAISEKASQSDLAVARSVAESALARNSFDRVYADVIDADVASFARVYADNLNADNATLASLTANAIETTSLSATTIYQNGSSLNSLIESVIGTRKIIAGTGLSGGGALTGNVTLSLATVGTAGTYTKTTVDSYGRVTSGSNPSTLSGLGITNAYTMTETDALINAVRSLAESALVRNSFDRIYTESVDSNVVSAERMYADAFEGNASSATKLASSRSLWGNGFDGTGDIGGSIIPLASDRYLVGNSTYQWSAVYSSSFVSKSSSALSIGANNSRAIYINTSNNITIGSANEAANYSGCKLYVAGDLRVSGNIIADGQVSAGGEASEGSSEIQSYVLHIDIDALSALAGSSGVANSVMQEIGFTAEAISYIEMGAYNKIIGDSTYPTVWEYSTDSTSGYLYIFIRRGDGGDRDDRYILRMGKGTKTWQVTFTEI